MVSGEARGLLPYVARLHAEWHRADPDSTHRRIPGTLVFADISGFTALTERLARRGKVGAEEMSDALNAVFTDILQPAHEYGADLVKWGGDAVLLLFTGVEHEARACRASHGMRARLRTSGRLGTNAGAVQLRMSVGIHTGDFDFYLVGDPANHRELLVSGPEVSRCVRLESDARAGDIAISPVTLAAIGDEHRGPSIGTEGVLLRGCPEPIPRRLPEQKSRPPDVRRLLPTEIRAHLLRGDTDPEHRDIAVGFVKFVGTDRLSVEEGPEAVAVALDEVIRNVSSAADQLGVTFFETDLDADGGKIMLACGVPTSAGHHAERMLRATRLMMDRAGRLQLKIGVNFGHVFAGDFGPPFRRTYSIKGDPINLAARVMGKARPGTVLATRAVVDRSETVFETTELEPFLVKGKSLPVHAVEVGRVLESPRDRRSHASLLVGRAAELEQIEAALDRLEWNRGQAIEILGPPGIGKSRLLNEAVRMAGDQAVYTVQCVEYDASSPYHLFWVLLHNMLKLPMGAPDGEAVAAYEAHVRRVAPDLMAWFPLLCTPLEYDVPETDVTRGLDDQFRRDKLEEVLVEFLHRLLPRKSLLIFDDVQYLDGASVGVLDRLVGSLGTRPLLVLLGRHDVTDGWRPADGADVATIKLEPLSAADALRLVQASNPARPLPPRVAAQLASKAGGNPLFLQSLLQEVDSRGDVTDLPDSVAELITVQIDRLPPDERTILRRISVLGTGFDLEQLPMLFDDPPTEEKLGRLTDFLQLETGRRWATFRHALMRDVAYEGLPFKVRRQLHGRIGAALERNEGAGARPEVLSLHYFHAHRFDKAWTFARLAGDQAKEQYANSEAVDQYNRAIEAARRLPQPVVPRLALGFTYESLADCWFTIGFIEPAGKAYRQALQLVHDDQVRRAEIVTKLALVDQRLRRFAQSLRRISRGVHSIEGLTGPKAHAARSRLYTAYARGRWSQGRMADAIAWSTRALDEAMHCEDRDILATAFGNLHGFHVAAGLPTPEPYGEMALEIYAEVGDLAGQAHSTNNLAVQAQAEFRWITALEMYSRAAEMFATIGDTANEGEASHNGAEVLVDQGRFDEAFPLLDHALTSARSASNDELTAYVLRLMGRALIGTGDVVRGLAVLDEARALFEEMAQPDELTEVGTWRCLGLLIDGDERAALTLTEALLTECADSPDRAATLRWIRGFSLLKADLRDQAWVEFEAGRLAADECGARYAFAVNCLGLSRCDESPADTWEGQAIQVLDELGVVALPLPARFSFT